PWLDQSETPRGDRTALGGLSWANDLQAQAGSNTRQHEPANDDRNIPTGKAASLHIPRTETA
ncbi:hypothetical protein PF005_g30389, partial [Phytophthora fragariae]